MFYILATLTLLLTAADHWTTYVCLRQPVDGWVVMEANPIAEWLFGSLGLANGLLFDSVITDFAVAFLLTTNRLPVPVKTTFFICVVLWTGHAVVNHLNAISMMGLSPFGGLS